MRAIVPIQARGVTPTASARVERAVTIVSGQPAESMLGGITAAPCLPLVQPAGRDRADRGWRAVSTGTLVLDSGTVRTTIESARRALDFLLGTLERPNGSSPDDGHHAAIELHRFADGIATLADQASAGADVVDLAAVRRARQGRTQDAEALR